MRLAVLTSHPIQYYAPLFSHLAHRLDLHVFFAHQQTPEQQAAAGFGKAFVWDLDLTSGYSHSFLRNVARSPSSSHFSGCDTPEIGVRLGEGQFDGVLTLGWHLKSLLQGTWAAKRLGLPVLIRGDSQLSTPRSTIKRWGKAVTYPHFLRLFDAALYVGKRNRAYYEHYGYPSDRLFSSPHCVDTERFRAAATPIARAKVRARVGADEMTTLVLFAGKLLPFKRPQDLVEAASVMRANGDRVEVMVAGAGELESTLRDRAHSLGVPLHLLGFQNQTEMPAAYAAADALVLPSERETWGLVCNEALACGRPIVVSNAVGCAPDLAGDGRVGRTFPLGDVRACAKALCGLVQSPPSPDEIASVSSRSSLAAAADGIIEALRWTRPQAQTRTSH